ncbi:hypothetical protein J2T08_004965 [Neorhizobium galegae]|uniref:hypothetical protein n=1 Tax=Neorhizobium galegae TaxID=399 RepID=UPI002780A255|nr:hypothetical protein [Neorhizobium galegae]MDQ0137026.1 hypothetical protein [Neorhizobium galegae]
MGEFESGIPLDRRSVDIKVNQPMGEYSMADLSFVATIALVALLTAFAFVTLIKLLDGSISMSGMLANGKDQPNDPERVVMLIGTIAGAFAYFSYGLKSIGTGGTLPPVPQEAVMALGGSNFLYIFGKIFRPRK